MVAPQERVAAVRPFWETQGQEERQTLLTVSAEALTERANELAIRQRKQAGESGAAITTAFTSILCSSFASRVMQSESLQGSAYGVKGLYHTGTAELE